MVKTTKTIKFLQMVATKFYKIFKGYLTGS